MSPLQVDGNYRGAHAYHVHPHPKLGKSQLKGGIHRTVITSALPVINWLIDDREVVKISLGQIAHSSGEPFKPRVECRIKENWARVLLVEKTVAQFFNVTATSPRTVKKIVSRIEAKWNKDVLRTGGLTVVS